MDLPRHPFVVHHYTLNQRPRRTTVLAVLSRPFWIHRSFIPASGWPNLSTYRASVFLQSDRDGWGEMRLPIVYFFFFCSLSVAFRVTAHPSQAWALSTNFIVGVLRRNLFGISLSDRRFVSTPHVTCCNRVNHPVNPRWQRIWVEFREKKMYKRSYRKRRGHEEQRCQTKVDRSRNDVLGCRRCKGMWVRHPLRSHPRHSIEINRKSVDVLVAHS